MWREIKKVLRAFNRGQAGVTLLESVIALAILGLIAVAILSSLATGAKATGIAREQAFAESLARSEIEYIKAQPYAPLAAHYPVDPSLAIHAADGWSIHEPAVVQLQYTGAGAQETTAENTGMQKITVRVERNGRLILSAVAYKVDR